ncbi:hypothetical protein D2909_02825 [Planococcus salinarum]|nr:hypothetical protein D2909_02825 [Planococcus salinarum]
MLSTLVPRVPCIASQGNFVQGIGFAHPIKASASGVSWINGLFLPTMSSPRSLSFSLILAGFSERGKKSNSHWHAANRCSAIGVIMKGMRRGGTGGNEILKKSSEKSINRMLNDESGDNDE